MVENWLTLAVWLVAGKPFRVKKFQKTLLTLSQVQDKMTHSLITSQLEENELPDLLGIL